MITRVHHVAVAVQDLPAALGFWRDTLELPLLREATLLDQGVQAALLGCGPAELEVLAPTGPDTGVARFLARRGEGLHHVCFESDDVQREVRRFVGTAVDMIDAKPRQGLAGKIAFIHPRSCAGLLVELATPPAPVSLPETSLALAAVHGKVADVELAAQRFQDLFGLGRGFTANDGSFVQLTLGGLTLQLTPLGPGFPQPALSALRLKTGDLPALARRLDERGIPCHQNPVGFVVAAGPARGAPLIVQSDR